MLSLLQLVLQQIHLELEGLHLRGNAQLQE